MVAVGDIVTGKVIGRLLNGQKPEIITGTVLKVYLRTVCVNSGGINYLIKIEDLMTS